MHNNNIAELEKNIGYEFGDKQLLKRALTHSSYSNEQKIKKNGDYERLEFLGDAVLEMISSVFFYHKYPSMPEGQLTKIRSSYVCEPALAACARAFGLEAYIMLGKGEEQTGGRNRDSIISDVCEALIGAMYLDGGFDVAHDFIHKYVLTDNIDKGRFMDCKSILQEKVQAMNHLSLEYVLVGEEGPDHDKVFMVDAVVGGNVMGKGQGKTKKSAEQSAAYEALKKLDSVQL